MAELPLDSSIPRFKTNESRIDTFANGSTSVDMVTSEGVPVPSIRKFIATWVQTFTDFIAEKNSEINENVDGLLGGAIEQAGIATTAAAAASADRFQVGLDRAATDAAKNAAISARDASFALGPKYATEALGRAAVGDGGTFLVQGSGEVAATEYRRVNSGSSTLLATYPSVSGVEFRAELESRNAIDLIANRGAVGFENYMGSTAEFIPVVGGSNGRLALWFNVAKQKLQGAFDIFTNLREAIAYLPMWDNTAAFEVHTGTGTQIPLAPVSKSGRMTMWYDTEDNKIHIPLLDVTAAVSPPTIAPAKRVALSSSKKFPLDLANTVYGHVSYGQSLSIGVAGQLALSTTQLFSNKTFGLVGAAGGVKSTLTGNGFGGVNQTAMATLMPLVEDNRSPDGPTNRGETVCAGTVNGAVELAYIENGVSPAQLRFFSSAAGKGGESIETLKKLAAPTSGHTENYYENFLDHVRQANTIYAGLGLDYVVALINYTQGEADKTDSVAVYKPKLTTLINDMQASVKAITGQTVSPHISFTQQGSGVMLSATGGPAQAMFELAREREDVHLATPIYHQIFDADGTHLTNVSYLCVGRYLGRQLKDLLVDGIAPNWIEPISAVAKGDRVYVKFIVPFGPLVLDAVNLAPTIDMGFGVRSDSGTSVIQNATIEGGDTLVLKLAAAPGTNAVVRAGFDHLGTSLVIDEGASTNLRDSSPAHIIVNGVNRPLWNVCPHFQFPIIKVQ